MKNPLDIPPPLSILEEWRRDGLTPQEIYQKSREFMAAVRRVPEARPTPESPRAGRAVEMYQAGQTLREIARILNCSHETVRQYLLQSGIALRPAHFPGRQPVNLPPDLLETVKAAGVPQASRDLGIPRTTLYNILRRRGINLRRSPGCPRCQTEPYARHLCKACYQLWLRRGKPELA